MKFSKETKEYMMMVLFFIVVWHIIFPTMVNFYKSFSQEGFKGRKSLLLLHMEGCGHCKKLMPEWDKFTQMNNTSIVTTAVEKDDDRALVKRYGVEGFPTILLLDSNGKKLDTYDGDRNAQGLLDYCKQNN
jgi:thiol-disulfide isomerase/thioredoxin